MQRHLAFDYYGMFADCCFTAFEKYSNCSNSSNIWKITIFWRLANVGSVCTAAVPHISWENYSMHFCLFPFDLNWPSYVVGGEKGSLTAQSIIYDCYFYLSPIQIRHRGLRAVLWDCIKPTIAVIKKGGNRLFQWSEKTKLAHKKFCLLSSISLGNICHIYASSSCSSGWDRFYFSFSLISWTFLDGCWKEQVNSNQTAEKGFDSLGVFPPFHDSWKEEFVIFFLFH